MQESVYLRTLRVMQIGVALTAPGGFPLLKLFGGTPAMPTNCAAGDPSLLLCQVTLPAIPLAFANGVATMLGNWSGIAINTGFVQSFRLYDSLLGCHVQGYASELWQPSTTYQQGQNVSNANGIYDCFTGGVSASIGQGPSGTGTGIVDGSAVWNYVAPAAEMILGSTNISSGLSLPVQSFSISAANA